MRGKLIFTQKNNIMKIIFFIISLLIALPIYSQTITGVVFSENNSPVSFANVVLTAADSSFVSGTITDETGKFSVEKKSNTKFLSVSCLGFETKILDLEKDNNFEKIVLKYSVSELKEIVVSGGLPKTQIKNGAMVTDVQNSSLVNSTSAEKMLAKIPGIRTTQDGIEVFGKGSPEIYINNVKIRDNSELMNLDPKTVKTVEVITNPGAEYDSEVQAVIKIITGSPVGEGFSFTYQSQYEQKHDADFTNKLSLNYRKGKFDVFGSILFYDAKDRQTTDHYNILNTNAKWEQQTLHKINTANQIMDINGGVNYEINEKNFVGFKYGYVKTFKDEADGFSNLNAFKGKTSYDYLSKNIYNNCEDRSKHSVNAYYNGNVGKMSVDFNVDYYAKQSTDCSENKENSLNFDERIISAADEINNKLFAEKLVLSHDLFGGKISLGEENTITDYKDNYHSFAENYIPTVKSKSKQRNTATFLQYSYNFTDNLNVNAGLRYENVDFKYYDDDVLDNEISKTYNNWFPSANISFSPGDVQMNLSYVKKTQRPSYYSLRNSYLYISRYEIESGNSELQPREISSLTYMASWKFVNIVASYRNTKNMTIYWNIEDETKPEVLISRTINYDKNFSQFYVNLDVSPEFGIYSPTVFLSVRKQGLNLVSQGITEHLNKTRLIGEIDHCLDFDNGLSFELDCYFNGKGHNEEYFYQSNYWTFDFCVNKTFFKDALIVEAGVSDITNKERRDVKIFSSKGYQSVFEKTDTRSFYLTFIYRFNPAKSKYKGTGAGNDEKQRM